MNESKKVQCACYSLDDKEGRFLIEVDLPGGEKRNITINLGKGSVHSTPQFVKG